MVSTSSIKAKVIAYCRDWLVGQLPQHNLDQGGERALNKALEFLKASGATIVMVSHRTGALPLVDHIIFMESGKVVKQGPADDIMPLISDQSRSASAEHLADQGVST